MPNDSQSQPTWEGDPGENNGVKDLFTAIDIAHMKDVSGIVGRNIYLDDYDNVKLNATMIYGMVKNQRMPPDRPWSVEYLETFRKWMDAGYPKSKT